MGAIAPGPIRRRPRLAARLALGVAAVASAARAGPPFVTDDPEPTDRGHWEVYTFVSGVRADGASGGQAGFDINYGAAEDLQLTAVVPLGYDTAQGRVGLGNVELAAKYRFLHQDKTGFAPDVSVFPRVFTPTGGTRLGTGHAQLLLPVWAEKDWGPWSVFGGGGPTFNPGRDQRDFWLYGLGVTRTLTHRLSLGAEVYHHTRDTLEGADFTGVNLGALYRLSDHWSLIGAGGPGVQGARREGQSSVYAALKADY
jgi:hypothetical protein